MSGFRVLSKLLKRRGLVTSFRANKSFMCSPRVGGVKQAGQFSSMMGAICYDESMRLFFASIDHGSYHTQISNIDTIMSFHSLQPLTVKG